MKRFLVAMLLCFSSMSIFSQRLLFKGYEISGNAWEMKEILEKEAYIYHRADEGRILLTGSYLGYNESKIHLYKTKFTSKLFAVQVTLNCPYYTNTSDQYNFVKDLLSDKYGKPIPATEFQNRNTASFSMCISWKLSDGEIILCEEKADGAVTIFLHPTGWRSVRDAELFMDM